MDKNVESNNLTDNNVPHELNEAFAKLKDEVNNAKESLYQSVQEAKDLAKLTAAHSLNSLKDKSSDAQDSVMTYVQNNLVKSMGFALLTGIVATQLFRSRK